MTACSSTNNREKKNLTQEQETNVIPNDQDILSGRGAGVNLHPGNVYFRSLIKEYKEIYLTVADASQKRHIIKEIVRKAKSNGGRFLKLDSESNLWVIVPSKEVEKKTGQAIREGGPTLREKIKQSSARTHVLPSEQNKPYQNEGGSGNQFLATETLCDQTAIDDESIRNISGRINFIKNQMNEVKREYNQLEEEHTKLMNIFLLLMNPSPATAWTHHNATR